MPCCTSERQLPLPSCATSAVSDREHDLRIAFDVGSSVPRRSTCGKAAAHRRSQSSWLQRGPLRTHTLRTSTVRQRLALSRQPSRDHQHPRQSVCRGSRNVPRQGVWCRFISCTCAICHFPVTRALQMERAATKTAKSDGLFGNDSRRSTAIARLAHCSFTHAQTWTTHRLVRTNATCLDLPRLHRVGGRIVSSRNTCVTSSWKHCAACFELDPIKYFL